MVSAGQLRTFIFAVVVACELALAGRPVVGGAATHAAKSRPFFGFSLAEMEKTEPHRFRDMLAHRPRDRRIREEMNPSNGFYGHDGYVNNDLRGKYMDGHYKAVSGKFHDDKSDGPTWKMQQNEESVVLFRRDKMLLGGTLLPNPNQNAYGTSEYIIQWNHPDQCAESRVACFVSKVDDACPNARQKATNWASCQIDMAGLFGIRLFGYHAPPLMGQSLVQHQTDDRNIIAHRAKPLIRGHHDYAEVQAACDIDLKGHTTSHETVQKLKHCTEVLEAFAEAGRQGHQHSTSANKEYVNKFLNVIEILKGFGGPGRIQEVNKAFTDDQKTAMDYLRNSVGDIQTKLDVLLEDPADI